MTPTVALLLALAVPAAPAPKGEKGLPKDLIDLIPEDTAGVLVLDVPAAAKSEIGKAFLKPILTEQKADEPVQVADFVRDAEFVIVAQFLIDEGFGDFCILVRHKEKSDIPKALIDRADKAGKDRAPEKIGKHMVYSLGSNDVSFARIDDRTLMFVLAMGSPEQVKETRPAAYGEREKPGPSPAFARCWPTTRTIGPSACMAATRRSWPFRPGWCWPRSGSRTRRSPGSTAGSSPTAAGSRRARRARSSCGSRPRTRTRPRSYWRPTRPARTRNRSSKNCGRPPRRSGTGRTW